MTRLRRMSWALGLVLLACDATSGRRDDWTRAKVAADLELFTAWAQGAALSPTPFQVPISLDPIQLPLFVRGVPRDPQRQLALGVLLLQGGHPREAVAPLVVATHDPALAGRAHALLGCTLVILGRYDEGVRHLERAPVDASCRWRDGQPWDGTVPEWIALARCGLGDPRGALDAIATSLGTRAVLADPSVAAEMEERDPAASLLCVAGDAHELAGDFASAATLWRRGHCADRLDELEASANPFDVLVERWPMPSLGRVDTAFAVAAAALGDAEGAELALQVASDYCSGSWVWTADCLRLRRVKSRVAAMLAGPWSPGTATGRTLRTKTFVERPVPRALRRPYDPDLDERPVDEALVPTALAQWNVVRVERDGSRCVALSSGRSGRGLLEDGSFRAHVSRDGGTTFDPPLCLGIGELAPYLVRARSAVPLVSGDDLQVEALRCRGRFDPEWSEWPCEDEPVSAILSFNLIDLTRDSDSDGLTDVQESWWLLDAEDPDTDGDTVVDARDPSPRLPTTSLRRELGSLVEWLVSDDVTPKGVPSRETDGTNAGKELETSVHGARAGASPIRQESLVLARLQPVPFLDQRWMWRPPGAVDPPRTAGPRVLALSEKEADALADTIPGYGTARLKIVLDLDGTRAFVDIDRGSEGGLYVAERSATGWTLRGLIGWVN